MEFTASHFKSWQNPIFYQDEDEEMEIIRINTVLGF